MSGAPQAVPIQATPSAAKPKWIPLARNYAIEHDKLSVKLASTNFHPLLKKEDFARIVASQQAEVAGAGAKPSSPVVAANAAYEDPLRSLDAAFDPLRSGGGAAAGGGDSLSDVAPSRTAGALSDAPQSESDVAEVARVQSAFTARQKRAGFEPWPEKKNKILAKYTTNSRMPVSASFLDDKAAEPTIEAGIDKAKAAATAGTEQAKSRLDALMIDENSDKGKNMLSQKEYIAHIEEQHERLKAAWDNGERVLALKIAIQCAKLLGDTSVPLFYPSMYVLLTAILDTFGDLVFERIKRKGLQVPPGAKVKNLPPNFKASDVSQSAKETCRNWFYKTACIRELMPRLYVDLALIKSYRFLEDGQFPKIFSRLSRAIRGIGDPLAASYARCFLCKKVGDVISTFASNSVGTLERIPPEYMAPIMEGFNDFMYTFQVVKSEDYRAIPQIKSGKVTSDQWVELFSPAVEWCLQNIGFKTSDEAFVSTLKSYEQFVKNPVVLVHIMKGFDARYVSARALELLVLVRDAEPNSEVPKSKLYLQLGHALVAASPPPETRLSILNDVWKIVTKITDIKEYMELATVFIQYLLQNFTDREVNIFIKDVIKHAKADNAFLQIQPELNAIIGFVIEYSKDLVKTLSMDSFLPLIDMLESKRAKIVCAKTILDKWSRVKGSTSDPVIIQTLFDVARTLHDSISSLSQDDEKKDIALLLIAFVRKIDFSKDLEQQLDIYVDCRQAFSSLDSVIEELVLRVAKLATKAHALAKGKHTRKTSAFVKACLAYCHITIPSLEDCFSRLHLLLQCAEVALMNNMVVQSEGFLKAAISLIPTVPKTIETPGHLPRKTEGDMLSFLRNFTAMVLVFPGHHKHGPFYMVKGLLNAIQSYEPWQAASEAKARFFLGLIQLFCAYNQREFLYRIERLDSNDTLYCNDAEYSQGVVQFLDSLIAGLLAQLTELGEKGDVLSRKQQGTMALELVNVLVSSMEMNPASATMVVKLFQLAAKNNAVDAAFVKATQQYIASKKGKWYEDISAKLRQG